MWRHGICLLTALLLLVGGAHSLAAGPREDLIAARTKAYDANFRNDQNELREAVAAFVRLTADAQVGAFANYYAAWTEWSLASSQVVANTTPAAIASLEAAVAHAASAVRRREDLAEFHAMSANALIALAVVDRSRMAALFPQVTKARQTALALGPNNPRVVMMDAGMIFNTPAEVGGSKEKGLDRWREALRLFDAEARELATDPLMPDWGRALAYGWLGNLYMLMTPPQTDQARDTAMKALELRPDFWWVREQLLPRLKG
jgi:tetratricopeptide (TPR) repeat protein